MASEYARFEDVSGEIPDHLKAVARVLWDVRENGTTASLTEEEIIEAKEVYKNYGKLLGFGQ